MSMQIKFENSVELRKIFSYISEKIQIEYKRFECEFDFEINDSNDYIYAKKTLEIYWYESYKKILKTKLSNLLDKDLSLFYDENNNSTGIIQYSLRKLENIIASIVD